MKRVKLHRSASVRMAVLFVGLFTIAICIAFTALYIKISMDLDDHQRADVLEVQKTVIAALEKGNDAQPAGADTSRLAAISDEDTVYLLTTGQNAYIAGNVKAVPQFAGWKLLPWSSLEPIGTRRPSEPEEGVLGLWTEIPSGHLFVGTSDGDVLEARDMLLEGLALALTIAILAALGGGVFIGLQTRQRIESISRVLDAASEGDLSVRIPMRPKGDELDHVSARINATLDRLRASIASLRQVTTDIAHDLKSPIGRVKQRLQTASVTKISALEYRDVVQSTVGEIDKIVDTFNALLSIAQIEGGLQKQRFAPQSLKSVLATVVDAYSAVAEDAGHELTCHLDNLEDVEVMGDRDLLTQLFANLVENSIRHCAAGAKIEIVSERLPDSASVHISDTGPGIPKEERQNVFRRLYRLEKSRTTPGSGLGLALVAAIAELHDVKIALKDNSPGLLVELNFPTRALTVSALAAE